VTYGKYANMWLIYMWLNLFPLYLADDFVVLFVALGISAPRRPLDLTASFLCRGQIFFLPHTLMIKHLLLSLLFLPVNVIYCNLCVTHFGPTCLTCVMHVRCEGLELSLFIQPRSGCQSVVFVMSHAFE
jgi:hypothetical protein